VILANRFDRISGHDGTPEWATLLDPEQPTVSFAYPEGVSSQWNAFEADAIAALAWLLYGRLADQPENEIVPVSSATIPVGTNAYGASEFWTRGVGVVTPHRAQQGLTISRLQQVFAPVGVEPSRIRDAVDTVERFQGRQRDVMLASFALGDPDSIAEEDEFLLSLNRFNVMASRARAKVVVLVSQEVVSHLSSDVDVLCGSRLLKVYAESFCANPRKMTLGYLDATGGAVTTTGVFRAR